MRGKVPLGMVVAVLALGVVQVTRSDPAAAEPQPPLEVLISESLQWRDNCLHVGIDRANRSSNTLFLPSQGLVVASSAVNAAPPSGHGAELIWVPVYGVSDILVFSAAPLAPGEIKHDDVCVGPTFAVTNAEKETRREVQLRGQLQIYAYYFLTREDWLQNKSQREELLHTAPDKSPKVLDPEVGKVTVTIPCRESACDPACDAPPIILDGEGEIIPDIMESDRDWNDRGKAINEELARKLPQCPAP